VLVLNQHLDTFAEEVLVDEIVTSRLDEQRLVHDRIVKGLKYENERLERTCHVLEGTNGELEGRLEVLENTSCAGGSAILCNKLRSREQRLVTRQRELSAEHEVVAQERVQHRRDLKKRMCSLPTRRSEILSDMQIIRRSRQALTLRSRRHPLYRYSSFPTPASTRCQECSPAAS